MGYSVDAIIFDSEILEGKIFPALRNGEQDPIIMETIQNLIDDEKVCLMEWDEPFYTHRFKGLEKVIKTFNNEMTESTLGRNFAVNYKGQIEKTNSRYNLSPKSHWGYESLIDLIEYTIIKNCAKYYGNLGSPYKIAKLLDFDVTNNLSNNYLVNQKLSKLDTYTSYYKHGNGGYGEGISGWLNNEEVRSLYSYLGKFEMKEELKHPKFSGVFTFLSMIEFASKENNGILIGRDLRITLTNRYSGNFAKLQLSNHVSGDGCVNFIGLKVK